MLRAQYSLTFTPVYCYTPNGRWISTRNLFINSFEKEKQNEKKKTCQVPLFGRLRMKIRQIKYS